MSMSRTAVPSASGSSPRTAAGTRPVQRENWDEPGRRRRRPDRPRDVRRPGPPRPRLAHPAWRTRTAPRPNVRWWSHRSGCRPPQPLAGRRNWGLTAQLYSVRSSRSWGIGDFADLADLAAVARRERARALSWSIRCTPPSPRRRWRTRRTCPPPGGSSTRCTSGWRTSPNTATWTPARPGRGRTACAAGCTRPTGRRGPAGPQRQLRGEAGRPGTGVRGPRGARPAHASSRTSARTRARAWTTSRSGARSPRAGAVGPGMGRRGGRPGIGRTAPTADSARGPDRVPPLAAVDLRPAAGGGAARGAAGRHGHRRRP